MVNSKFVLDPVFYINGKTIINWFCVTYNGMHRTIVSLPASVKSALPKYSWQLWLLSSSKCVTYLCRSGNYYSKICSREKLYLLIMKSTFILAVVDFQRNSWTESITSSLLCTYVFFILYILFVFRIISKGVSHHQIFCQHSFYFPDTCTYLTYEIDLKSVWLHKFNKNFQMQVKIPAYHHQLLQDNE